MECTLRQLEIFLAVARQGHVTRAAAELHLTQSAVSTALAELGRRLGGPLFERAGRGVAPTARGERLVAEADDLLRRAEDLEQRFRSGRALAGRLRVGASSTIGAYLLPPLLGTFVRDHAAVQIDLEVGNTAAIEAALTQRRLDVAFVEGPPQGAGSVVHPFGEDRLVVFGAAGHALAARRARRLPLAAVAAQRWIVREPGSGTRAVFDAALREHGITLVASLQLGHSEAVKLAVRSGLGLGCLSQLAIAAELERGELVALATPELDLRRPLWRLERPQAYRSALLECFVAHAAAP